MDFFRLETLTLTIHQKWEMLMANRPPVDVLGLPDILRPRGDYRPPLYYFGVPVTSGFAVEYAERRHPKFHLDEDDRDFYGCKEVLNMADFDDVAPLNPDMRSCVVSISKFLMLEDLETQCRWPLIYGHPFCRP